MATLVLAYGAGGPGAVGLLAIARFLVPALVAPLAGMPTTRWAPEAVLRAAFLLRALAVIILLGVVVVEAPSVALFVAAALEAAAGAFNRPIHMALLPAIARTPQQLVAANVASAAVEGLGSFAGPALAGMLLVVAGPQAAILGVILIDTAGVLAAVGLHVPAVGRSRRDARAVLGQVSAGLSVLAGHAGPRLVILAFGLQTVVRGLLTVLLVVAAIELLGLGAGGVGTLNAAIGLGGLVGAVVAVVLAGRSSMTGPFTIALAAWGLPIAVMGLVIDPIVAVLAMGAVGLANALLDVAGFTLLQRTTPNASRVAVFGVLETVANAGLAVGGIAAPLLVAALGSREALVVAGAILPVVALLTGPLLQRVDEGGPAGARRLELVRGDPLFRPLSLATCEHLAATLRPVAFDPGEALMREGESGDDYLLIDTGAVRVEQRGRWLRDLGPGGGAGEIALLHAMPRTATVRALGPVTAFALEREAFLEAITGHRVAHELATAGVRRRLAEEP